MRTVVVMFTLFGKLRALLLVQIWGGLDFKPMGKRMCGSIIHLRSAFSLVTSLGRKDQVLQLKDSVITGKVLSRVSVVIGRNQSLTLDKLTLTCSDYQVCLTCMQ